MIEIECVAGRSRKTLYRPKLCTSAETEAEVEVEVEEQPRLINTASWVGHKTMYAIFSVGSAGWPNEYLWHLKHKLFRISKKEAKRHAKANLKFIVNLIDFMWRLSKRSPRR